MQQTKKVLTPIITLFTTCAAGIALLFALPHNLRRSYQTVGLLTVFIAVYLGCVIYSGFSLDALQFQFLSETPWLPEIGIEVNFGLDGISFIFLVLTALLFPFCVLAS